MKVLLKILFVIIGFIASVALSWVIIRKLLETHFLTSVVPSSLEITLSVLQVSIAAFVFGLALYIIFSDIGNLGNICLTILTMISHFFASGAIMQWIDDINGAFNHPMFRIIAVIVILLSIIFIVLINNSIGIFNEIVSKILLTIFAMANTLYVFVVISLWREMGIIFQMSSVIRIILIVFFALLSIISIKLITTKGVLSKILLVIYFIWLVLIILLQLIIIRVLPFETLREMLEYLFIKKENIMEAPE